MSGHYTGAPTPPGEYFPYTDLSEEYTAILKPILVDGIAVEECHKNVDEFYPLYRMGHSALEQLVIDLELEEDKRISFLHGITLYEVAATIARPWAPRYSKAIALQNIDQVKSLAETPDLVVPIFNNAFTKFLESQENTMKLITDAVSRDEYFDRYFVLQGAAVVRALETDVIEDAAASNSAR